MKRLTSIKNSAGAFNIGTLILRLACGGLMLPHGYEKLIKFAEYKKDFMSFLGLGPTVSFGLLVFAEFFCAGLVLLGFLTRFAAIPPVIAMTVALFEAHHGLIFTEGEHAALYALGFLAIVFLGPGKISVDGAIRK